VRMVGCKPLRVRKAVLVCFCVLLAGCGGRNANPGPSIEFTKVPLAGHGGPDRLDTIEGRVVGARPGQQIVLFARWGPWWVQPLADQPFTPIQPDSKWKNSTHFGTEYAALLVEPGYRPQPTMEVLPREGSGVAVVAIIKGRTVFWQTWWFLLGIAAAFALMGMMLFRLRMNRVTRLLSLRLEERLAERTRIAQELHDTLLQDFLSASMQLHVANDQMADDAPAKAQVNRVLDMMGRVIQEGRNTVQGLRSSDWGSEHLEQAFSRVRQELAVTKRARFRVIVGGIARPLRPVIGDDVYLIGREALANAFHHSGASEIEVELEYAANQLRLLVRDNGCGMASEALLAARHGHSGFSRMRERAERIGAKLRVLSREAAGMEIELSVPGHIAYFPRDSDSSTRWLSRLGPRKLADSDSSVESERVG
jgi:histidine kinase/histidine kinase/DNA gyrase B/HSP90-like ATPase